MPKKIFGNLMMKYILTFKIDRQLICFLCSVCSYKIHSSTIKNKWSKEGKWLDKLKIKNYNNFFSSYTSVSTIFKFRAKKKTTTSNWQLILKVNIYFNMKFFKIFFWQYLKINLMAYNDLKIWIKNNEWLKNYRSRNIIKLQGKS